MRKVLVSLFAFTLTFLGTPAIAEKSDWQIASFDSQLQLTAEGKVEVTETISTHFSVPKHGIFRDIPITYQGAEGIAYTKIDVTGVSRNNEETPYEIEQNDAYLRLKVGDPDRTVQGDQTYVIRYVATGALRGFSDYDELYWNVTGNSWEVPIAKATATVKLPKPGFTQSACYQGAVQSNEGCTGEITTPSEAHFTTTRELRVGEGFTVAAGYTKGLVPLLTVEAPADPFEVLLHPTMLITNILVFALGIFYLVRRWLLTGRDKSSGRATVVAEYEAPGGLRPAEIGVLMDERADTLDVSATIVDLAARGFLTITELPKKWTFGEIDYTFKRTSQISTELLAYEQELLASLFKDGDEVALSSLKNNFYDDLAKVKKLIYAEVTRKGLFAENPETVRTHHAAISIAALLLGIGACFGISALVQQLPALLAQIGFGTSSAISQVGFWALLATFAMPARTLHGAELLRQSKGFELFINTAEKYRAQFAEKENLYTDILPYAIVFKSTKKLAKAMEKLGVTPPQPTWYHGSHAFHAVAFADSMNSFSSSLSTAMASTPGGSGSGGSGFSGGGFGGGGGGSW